MLLEQVQLETMESVSIKKTSFNELFSSTPTKRRLAKYLAIGLLVEYEYDSLNTDIASNGLTIAINKPNTLPDTFTSHHQEEADTLIPLHILFIIEYKYLFSCSSLHFDVHFIDTGVLCFLLDLVSNYARC